jgi:hypothetical protein
VANREQRRQSAAGAAIGAVKVMGVKVMGVKVMGVKVMGEVGPASAPWY